MASNTAFAEPFPVGKFPQETSEFFPMKPQAGADDFQSIEITSTDQVFVETREGWFLLSERQWLKKALPRAIQKTRQIPHPSCLNSPLSCLARFGRRNARTMSSMPMFFLHCIIISLVGIHNEYAAGSCHAVTLLTLWWCFRARIIKIGLPSSYTVRASPNFVVYRARMDTTTVE